MSDFNASTCNLYLLPTLWMWVGIGNISTLFFQKQHELDLVRPDQEKVRNDYADALKLLMQLQQQAQQKLAERAEKQRVEAVLQQQNTAFTTAFPQPTAQKVKLIVGLSPNSKD